MIGFSAEEDLRSIHSDDSFRKEAELHAIDFDMH